MSTNFTAEEAARIAHVSVPTIHYWKKTGRIQTVPKFISKRSGKPYGWLVPSTELEKARPDLRMKDLKKQHPGNLLTAREIARLLDVTKARAYFLIRRYGLERHYIDGCQYMVDGEQLAACIEEDPELWYLVGKGPAYV